MPVLAKAPTEISHVGNWDFAASRDAEFADIARPRKRLKVLRTRLAALLQKADMAGLEPWVAQLYVKQNA